MDDKIYETWDLIKTHFVWIYFSRLESLVACMQVFQDITDVKAGNLHPKPCEKSLLEITRSISC